VSRSWELFLQDMLEAARKIIRYTGSRKVEDFVADEMAYDATLRNMCAHPQRCVHFLHLPYEARFPEVSEFPAKP